VVVTVTCDSDSDCDSDCDCRDDHCLENTAAGTGTGLLVPARTL
jgi:hypothetical protein